MMQRNISAWMANEASTMEFAARLAAVLPASILIFLQGELGAGKTTFCRGALRGLGHSGAVKSPTFTLVEPYRLGERQIFHFDLYRLNDPNELEYIGVEDYLDRQSVCLVEWPERGEDFLPACDLWAALTMEGAGRRLTVRANSEIGEQVIRALETG